MHQSSMNEQPLLFEYKVWGTITPNYARWKIRVKIIGIACFILLVLLQSFFKAGYWIAPVIIIVAGTVLLFLQQRRQTTLQLTAAAMTISSGKSHTIIPLEDVQCFWFHTHYKGEYTDDANERQPREAQILVVVRAQGDLDIGLYDMSHWKVRQLLNTLYDMGYPVYLPYEDLALQDSKYYLPDGNTNRPSAR